jgi:hypothetical protein
MTPLLQTLVHEPLPCSGQESWGITKRSSNWANEILPTFHLDSYLRNTTELLVWPPIGIGPRDWSTNISQTALFG